MNIHDDISDDDVLRATAASLSALPVARPPAAESIMARGRARRRRTVAGLGLAGAAGVAVLALGVGGVFGGHTAAPAGTTIRTAAFTLARNANGTATLTLTKAQVFNPTALQQALQRDGIPALVEMGSYCSSSPAPPRRTASGSSPFSCRTGRPWGHRLLATSSRFPPMPSP